MGKGVDETVAMSSGEQGIVSTLQDAISLFRSNLSFFVSDIYQYETPESQQQITSWWQNPNNQINVQVGYNSGPVLGLSWNVSIGPDQELPAQQFVGSNAYLTGTTYTQVSSFESAYVIAILGIGQDWLRWSQMLCKWALLYYRQSLEENYGLLHQRVSMGPLQPVPDDLKDAVKFGFMRTATLSAQHEDTWQLLPLDEVQSVSITMNSI